MFNYRETQVYLLWPIKKIITLIDLGNRWAFLFLLKVFHDAALSMLIIIYAAITNPDLFLQLVKMPIPFGKYKDYLLYNLPVAYLEWFKRKGFPKGKMGILLETIYEIKINGLEYLLTPLKK